MDGVRRRGRVRMRGGIRREQGGGRGQGRGRGRGRGRPRGGVGHAQRRRQPNLCNEIRATIVDHVINHGLTLREAGLRVQPNLSRYTVASIVWTFRQEHRIERQEHQGGRGPIFTQEQEREIINLVLANNAIRLREIQAHIVNDHQIFNNVQQRVLQMDAEEVPHEFIYIDEAGFNLTTVRRRGRNIIGHRAIVNLSIVPLWSKTGFINTHNFTVQYLPPYSPSLNPIEEFFSAWRWKVYDLRPYVQMALIQAMEEACDQIEAASIQGWICHSKRFFPRCLANENIACDVDEALWPDPARWRDV
ncbi:Estrogen receptor [Labeo rohita]|uniref:Estrogen receptor n=1 Tax=Labeo rohita TaxID=84645 RepID=A0ABQ8MCC4_LABRO|nr:Estrogen receptor [Labeo rohita]